VAAERTGTSAYRDDLAAAQARVAQLEEELRGARGVGENERLGVITEEVDKGRRMVDPKRLWLLRLGMAGVPAFFGVVLFFLLASSGQLGGAFGALAACSSVALLYGLLIPRAAAKQGARLLAKAEQQLDGATRLRRLEAEVRTLRGELTHLRSIVEGQRVRVADASADEDPSAASRYGTFSSET